MYQIEIPFKIWMKDLKKIEMKNKIIKNNKQ